MGLEEGEIEEFDFFNPIIVRIHNYYGHRGTVGMGLGGGMTEGFVGGERVWQIDS